MRVFDDTKERTGSGNKTLHPPPPPAPAWHPGAGCGARNVSLLGESPECSRQCKDAGV